MKQIFSYEWRKIRYHRKNKLCILAIFLLSIIINLQYQAQDKGFANEKINIYKNEQVNANTHIKLLKETKELTKTQDEREVLNEQIQDWQTFGEQANVLEQYFRGKEYTRQYSYSELQITHLQYILDGKKNGKDFAEIVCPPQRVMALTIEAMTLLHIENSSMELYRSPTTMNMSNYMTHVVGGMNFILFVILIIFLSFDHHAEEFEYGTYKLVFSAPISRTTIVVCKMIFYWFLSVSLLVLSWGIPLFLSFVTNGTGDLNYPLYVNEHQYITAAIYICKMIVIIFPLLFFLQAFLSMIASFLKNQVSVIMVMGLIVTLVFVFHDIIQISERVRVCFPFFYLYLDDYILQYSNTAIVQVICYSILFGVICMFINVVYIRKHDVKS